MANPRVTINNIKTLAKRYGKGASLRELSVAATPNRVSISALSRALREAGVTIRNRGNRGATKAA